MREDRDISEWQDCADQLGDTSHLIESPPRSPQAMDDVEREQGSVAPSIISSSFYSDESLPEEGPLEERAPSKETPLQPIASAPMEATEETETL